MWTSIKRAKATSAKLAKLDDDVVTDLMDAAEDAIEHTINRLVKEANHEERLNGDGTRMLSLKNFPVTSITEITIIDSDGVEEDHVPGEFRLEADTGIVTVAPNYSFYFPCGDQNIVAKYLGGFKVVPQDLISAAIMVASHFSVAESGHEGKTMERLGDFEQRWENRGGGVNRSDWPSTAMAIIRRYAV